jgi:hypothetical protein
VQYSSCILYLSSPHHIWRPHLPLPRLARGQLHPPRPGRHSCSSLAEQFLARDGCLHALVGFLSSGSDAPRQLLAIQCLVNLAGRPSRHTGAIAKAAGAYLVTLVSGTN